MSVTVHAAKIAVGGHRRAGWKMAFRLGHRCGQLVHNAYRIPVHENVPFNSQIGRKLDQGRKTALGKLDTTHTLQLKIEVEKARSFRKEPEFALSLHEKPRLRKQ